MATTTKKNKLVHQVLTSLGRGGKESDAAPRFILEQYLYAVCREGATREAADHAYRSLRERFFDWNEIRVSSPREIAEVLDEFLPDGEARAQRIIDFLQEVFETTFSFDLEGLQKKGPKQAAKQLARYQSASDFAVAWVVQQSLGGHAVPLEASSLRVLRRLGIIEEHETDLDAIHQALEHQIPKARSTEFADIIAGLAMEHCHEEEPECPRCPLHKHCPTGIEVKLAAAPAKKPR